MSINKPRTWNVTSLKKGAAASFDIVADNLEYAACDALLSLGWDMSPASGKHNSEFDLKPEPASESKRPVSSTDTDDLTSSDVLFLARNQRLQLSLSLSGFLTTRFLSAESDGFYSHTCGNGEVTKITADDFMRIYPDAMEAVWRVVQVMSIKQVPTKTFLSSVKSVFASSFCVLVNYTLILRHLF